VYWCNLLKLALQSQMRRLAMGFVPLPQDSQKTESRYSSRKGENPLKKNSNGTKAEVFSVPHTSVTKGNIEAAFHTSERYPDGDEYQQKRIEYFGKSQRENLVALGAIERLMLHGAPAPVDPTAVAKKKDADTTGDIIRREPQELQHKS
jgi:hypothetical protein